MFQHHLDTVQRTKEFFERDPQVTGLLLAGSLAHGFATAESDVDVMIIVSDDDHRDRLQTGRTCFFSRELCTYAAGYVDGKYVSQGLLEQVRAKGSEPARYAFQDARVLFSRSESLPGLVRDIARYPVEEKEARLWRFQAQFEAWFWYTSEAIKKQNLPLLRTAVSKLTLFGGRVILAHNELLYPYHKWFLRVLEAAPAQPTGLLALIQELAQDPTSAATERFGNLIREFRPWKMDHAHWPAQFMQDSELNWLVNPPPVDDI